MHKLRMGWAITPLPIPLIELEVPISGVCAFRRTSIIGRGDPEALR